jgi:Predicted acid phosphatase
MARQFCASTRFYRKITLNALLKGLPEGVVLNVNIPNVNKEDIKGIKVCRQANGYWKENFDKRKSPFGKEYYWLSGEFVSKDKGQDTDVYALEQNYVSVVPVQFDMTAHHAIQKINTWDF